MELKFVKTTVEMKFAETIFLRLLSSDLELIGKYYIDFKNISNDRKIESKSILTDVYIFKEKNIWIAVNKNKDETIYAFGLGNKNEFNSVKESNPKLAQLLLNFHYNLFSNKSTGYFLKNKNLKFSIIMSINNLNPTDMSFSRSLGFNFFKLKNNNEEGYYLNLGHLSEFKNLIENIHKIISEINFEKHYDINNKSDKICIKNFNSVNNNPSNNPPNNPSNNPPNNSINESYDTKSPDNSANKEFKINFNKIKKNKKELSNEHLDNLNLNNNYQTNNEAYAKYSNSNLDTKKLNEISEAMKKVKTIPIINIAKSDKLKPQTGKSNENIAIELKPPLNESKNQINTKKENDEIFKCVKCGAKIAKNRENINNNNLKCLECESKENAVNYLKNLLENLEPEELFNKNELIAKYDYDESVLTEYIWTLQEHDLVNFDEKTKYYSLENKETLTKFVEESVEEELDIDSLKKDDHKNLSKICKICNEEFPIKQFYRINDKKYSNICKDCFEKTYAVKSLIKIINILGYPLKIKEEEFLKEYSEQEDDLWTLQENDLMLLDSVNNEYYFAEEQIINEFLEKYGNKEEEKTVEEIINKKEKSMEYTLKNNNTNTNNTNTNTNNTSTNTNTNTNKLKGSEHEKELIPQKKPNGKYSDYKGVSYNITRKLWIASVKINKKIKQIGAFESEEKAYQGRCKYLNRHPSLKKDSYNNDYKKDKKSDKVPTKQINGHYSLYKGISYGNASKSWSASVVENKKRIHLGRSFNTEYEAIQAKKRYYIKKNPMLATIHENSENVSNNGVSFDQESCHWKAEVNKDKDNVTIGYFESEDEAIDAKNRFLKKNTEYDEIITKKTIPKREKTLTQKSNYTVSNVKTKEKPITIAMEKSFIINKNKEFTELIVKGIIEDSEFLDTMKILENFAYSLKKIYATRIYGIYYDILLELHVEKEDLLEVYEILEESGWNLDK
ncbi:hypothetical protein [Methanobrevibacter filiformis]|uniref:AP2 domain protein n=1 Tax=Methanobrevibacter filiformis TaxID=55758 RepID=A0A166CPP2_9EURY|nr:hypothetical protein [Methanobrevibacter filiformis]KZX14736.1 AP2 domain protein [Methanobrevibacter filiformis]